MLAAFQQYGLQPGPLLFDSNPDLVWGLIASLYIGNVLLLVLNLPMAGVWVKLLHIPKPWLYAGILVFATMGAYTLNNNVVDLMILWIIGILGFGMRVLDVPVAPCVVGLILGPLAEQQFRRALVDQPGRPVGVLHPPDLAGAARHRGPAGDHADRAAPPPAAPRLRHRLTRPPSSRNTAMLESLTSLFTLTVLEVVLSIDNLVVIAVLVGKLPKDQQADARYVGMTLALLPRLVLLVFIGWIIGLTEPLFTVFGHGVSGKDLILAAGGLFLIYKATHEIHSALEGDEGEASAKVLANYAAVVAQIAIINLVFSIDSIVTAVGMANEIWIMAVAVILSMMVLMFASGPGRHLRRGASDREDPGAGFLIMIGMALVADGFGAHVPKGYIYTAMVFSVFIELINMKQRRKAKPVHLRNPYGEETETGGDERRALEQAGMPGAGAADSLR